MVAFWNCRGQLASGARNTFWVIWVHLPAARIWRRTALRVSPIAGLSRHGAPSEPCPAPQKPSLWPCPLATRTSPSRTYVGSTSGLPPFFLRSTSVSFAEVERRLYGGGTEVERRYPNEWLVGVRVWDGLKVGVRVRGADVSGEIGARNRHETPGRSGATIGFEPAIGRDGLRRRGKSGYGGARGLVRRRFRRGEGGRGGLAGGNEGAGDFRQIRPAVGVLTGADEDRGADHRRAIPGNVKSRDVAPAIDRRGQQTQQGEMLHAADASADRGGALHRSEEGRA